MGEKVFMKYIPAYKVTVLILPLTEPSVLWHHTDPDSGTAFLLEAFKEGVSTRGLV